MGRGDHPGILFQGAEKHRFLPGRLQTAGLALSDRKNTFIPRQREKQPERIFPEQLGAENTPEERLLDADTAFALHTLLHVLEQPYKEVFWMRTFGELSFKDIGRIWGKTESWARVTYHRARIKLKEGIQ